MALHPFWGGDHDCAHTRSIHPSSMARADVAQPISRKHWWQYGAAYFLKLVCSCRWVLARCKKIKSVAYASALACATGSHDTFLLPDSTMHICSVLGVVNFELEVHFFISQSIFPYCLQTLEWCSGVTLFSRKHCLSYWVASVVDFGQQYRAWWIMPTSGALTRSRAVCSGWISLYPVVFLCSSMSGQSHTW